jgi:hypothetical protein
MPPHLTITKLRSKAKGRYFSSVIFSGDTDMETDGWVALTSIDRPEVVITEVSQDEHQAADGLLRCEQRVNSALARSDLRVVWFKRAGNRSETPRRLFYRDIFDSEGDAELLSEISIEDFERSGWKITCYEIA